MPAEQDAKTQAPVAQDVPERCGQCGHYAKIVAYGCCAPCVSDVEREANEAARASR